MRTLLLGILFIFPVLVLAEPRFRPSPEGELVSDLEVNLARLPEFTWAVDPFLRMPGVNRQPIEQPEYKLQATSMAGEDAVAVVNDHVVRVGDKIGARTVLKIGKDFVLLGDNGSVFEVVLEEGKVSGSQAGRSPAAEGAAGDGQVRVEEVKK